jgi:hypothetical protein
MDSLIVQGWTQSPPRVLKVICGVVDSATPALLSETGLRTSLLGPFLSQSLVRPGFFFLELTARRSFVRAARQNLNPRPRQLPRRWR